MKKLFSKLKYNLWLYFVIFTLVIVSITWLVQILLFDGIYQQQKISELEQTGEQLLSSLNTEAEIDNSVTENWLSLAIKANEAGIFTYIAYYDDNNKLNANTLIMELADYHSVIVNNANNQNSNVISNQNGEDYNRVIFANSAGDIAKPPENNNLVFIESVVEDLNNSQEKYVTDTNREDGNIKYYVYATTFSNNAYKNGYLILISSQQKLIDSIKVIQSQLIIVTIIDVIIAFFLALIMANKLSKPIVEMSNTAKLWAEGQNDAVFTSNNYQELDELADALNYAKEEINKSGELQRDLLANVSHDLKTPLTMIKAYGEMIRDLSGDIKEKREAHTQVIIDEADRLTMLVNDILDLSKLQNGCDQLNITQVNISEVLERVIFRFKDFVSSNGYTIISDIEPDLFTMCDEQKIEQVFYNLIGNSINYTGDDKTIKIKLCNKNNKILFETIDSGKGISEEKISTIWDKYYRFSETHKRPIKGTGLGLSIVKTILENHKLTFGVISKKDIGSNFYIEFKVIT